MAICVEAVGVDSSIETSAKGKVEEAISEIRKHPRREAAGLGSASPLVDIGCPSPPAALRDGVKIGRVGSGVISSPYPCVEEASYYNDFVFIVSPEELERVFGDNPLTHSQQEVFCGYEYENVGVTGGLYLTPADLDGPGLLETLSRAVGLWFPEEWR